MRMLGTLAALAILAAAAACNTVEGFGRDVQTGGATLSDTAQSVGQRL